MSNDRVICSVNFAVSPEQDELRRSVRRFLESTSPSTEVRRLMGTDHGYDEAVWGRMARELGLQSLHLPEACGGQGFSFVELVIVLEEMGRALLCAPYLASVCLAANAVLNGASEAQQHELLPGIAAGETIATLAFVEPSARWDAGGIGMEAVRSDAGWRLDGTKMFVLDGHIAGLVVVAARRPGSVGAEGVSLFAVRGGAEGLTRRPLATMDQTRKLARLDFAGVRAELLGEEGAGWAPLSRTLDQAAVCLSAEMVGGAQRCLDMSVEYARERVQFGRPIGSFQAIKHKCADMLLEVESARSAVAYAGGAAADDGGELPVAASLAKAYCSEAYSHAAAENIQIHGGIGFTWEHDAHLYFKRAKSSEILLGDASFHRELLAQRIGI
jgi:alkylation response protein AidB-like acyl-CoA dehydrogenase